jgi:hypothetical protein
MVASKLSVRAGKWLKTFHIYLACIWGGGAASLFAIHCLFNPDPGPELFARNLALIYVDDYIMMPSALGCLITGLVYAQLTTWGYLKYYWIIVKGSANMIFLLAGYFWFIPWLGRMAETSLRMRSYLLTDPAYDAAMQVHMAMAFGQAVLVFILVLLSVFKPWGKTGINW